MLQVRDPVQSGTADAILTLRRGWVESALQESDREGSDSSPAPKSSTWSSLPVLAQLQFPNSVGQHQSKSDIWERAVGCKNIRLSARL